MILKAYLLLWIWVAASTELLSSADAFRPAVIRVAWGILLAGFISLLMFGTVRKRLMDAVQHLRQQETLQGSMLGIYAGFALLTAYVAWSYSPSNWDSMTYHLPRAFHWLENGHIGFYPTFTTRQNTMPPLAEYGIAHTMALTGGDHFAQFIQWLAFLVCGVGVASITRLMRGSMAVALLFMCTLPMALLQASSTQNDLVVSSFLLAFATFLLKAQRRDSLKNSCWAGMALGLALLTKGTAYPAGAGLGIAITLPWLLERNISFPGFWRRVGHLTLLLLVAAACNVGHWSRNLEADGHPLSLESKFTRMETVSLQGGASNLLRNSALHFTLPSKRWNERLATFIGGALGAAVHDPATTLEGTKFWLQFRVHEDVMGNGAHTLLLSAGLILFVIQSFRKGREIHYAWGLFAGVSLYLFLIKWQPWATRLHTPWFILAIPPAAAGWTIWQQKPWFRIIAGLLVLSGILICAKNELRPLPLKDQDQSRWTQMFRGRPGIRDDYKQVLRILEERQASEVYLNLNDNDWEYPLLAYPFDHRVRVQAWNAVPTDTWVPFLINSVQTKRSFEGMIPLYQGSTLSLWLGDPPGSN